MKKDLISIMAIILGFAGIIWLVFYYLPKNI